MSLLNQITYSLPDTNAHFKTTFLDYLSVLGVVKPEESIEFTRSSSEYLPITKIVFTDITLPTVAFNFDDGTSFDVLLTNITSITKDSPHQYTAISLSDFKTRVKNYELVAIDHTGFNLPYFSGVHPEILDLRQKLKTTCLYHTFPRKLADEPWDFILPGTKEEIAKQQSVDYSQVRTPKIELVSFNKSSTPLIQLEIQLNGKYQEWVSLFPEAIAVPEISSLWIYIENDFGIDVCFVLNQVSRQDWGHYFENERLK